MLFGCSAPSAGSLWHSPIWVPMLMFFSARSFSGRRVTFFRPSKMARTIGAENRMGRSLISLMRSLRTHQVGGLSCFSQPITETAAFGVRWVFIEPLLVEHLLAGQLHIPIRIVGWGIAVHFSQDTTCLVLACGGNPVLIADAVAAQIRTCRLGAVQFELRVLVFCGHDFVLAAIAADFEGGGMAFRLDGENRSKGLKQYSQATTLRRRSRVTPDGCTASPSLPWYGCVCEVRMAKA